MCAKPNFAIEYEEYVKGCKLIAGIDEAGRGSLAGPLSVSMVIYPEEFFKQPPKEIVQCIDDSKKLSHKKRTKAKDIITTYCMWWDCLLVPVEIIDEKNINGATYFAITRLLQQCPYTPDKLLIDGNFSFPLALPYHSIIKGDCCSISIASASIIAKVTRDEYMMHIDAQYPEYGFAHHKGYATKEHIEAIKKCGPSPLHRRTYEPVASLFCQELSLFE
ncbi:MAG: ribonuclease HII [Spirochaetes bacterium]|nr:ribonuclease HII [Spirochaetota bacterium]